MTEIKDSDREIHHFRMRLTVLLGLVFVCFGLLVARFVWLQVIQHDTYHAGEINRMRSLLDGEDRWMWQIHAGIPADADP